MLLPVLPAFSGPRELFGLFWAFRASSGSFCVFEVFPNLFWVWGPLLGPFEASGPLPGHLPLLDCPSLFWLCFGLFGPRGLFWAFSGLGRFWAFCGLARLRNILSASFTPGPATKHAHCDAPHTENLPPALRNKHLQKPSRIDWQAAQLEILSASRLRFN